jgi:hypothetical protein
VKKALAKRKALGLCYGTPELGYKCSEHGNVVADRKERALIKRMISMSEKGLAHYEIANILNEEQITTRRGGTWVSSTVGRFIRRGKEIQERWTK